MLALITWQKPNLLLLDEPTNHLDLEMRHALTSWRCKGFRKGHGGGLHDRHLLRTATDDFYLKVHGGRVEPFDGDLDDYHSGSRSRREANAKPTDGTVSRQLGGGAQDQKRLEAQFRQTTRPLPPEAGEARGRHGESCRAGSADIEQQLADPAI